MGNRYEYGVVLRVVEGLFIEDKVFYFGGVEVIKV